MSFVRQIKFQVGPKLLRLWIDQFTSENYIYSRFWKIAACVRERMRKFSQGNGFRAEKSKREARGRTEGEEIEKIQARGRSPTRGHWSCSAISKDLRCGIPIQGRFPLYSTFLSTDYWWSVINSVLNWSIITYLLRKEKSLLFRVYKLILLIWRLFWARFLLFTFSRYFWFWIVHLGFMIFNVWLCILSVPI